MSRWVVPSFALISLFALVGCSRAPDPSAPAGLRSNDPKTPAVTREDFERALADRLPKDNPTLTSLDLVAPYFEESTPTIWADFENTAGVLNGEDLKSDPRDVMLGCFEVMRRLKVEPNGHQRIREFCSEYRRAREGAAVGGEIRPTTHKEAVDLMVDRGAFSTR